MIIIVINISYYYYLRVEKMEWPFKGVPSWAKEPRPLFLCEEKPLDAGCSRKSVIVDKVI